MNRPTSATWSVWRWPLTLAALTLGGLFAALLGDSLASQAMSWVALSIPLVVLARHLTR
ncbi:MAG: hypothetical protein GAK28_03081 [Luteibacter sp.]|uniref:hypothetical protein n=1 Tax=Luteibacter sp. TaxID=1886636 RepID=UPI00137E9035|nr:hypothetical protein [Luteibacter sp.]KAF1005600.1 MAG: hypothetical protein GAK28_03081 [Luteibacter sp.]